MRSNLQFVAWQKREYVVARRLFIRQHSERKRKWKLEEARVVIFQFRKRRRIEKVVFRAPSDDDLSWSIFSFSVTLLQGVGEGSRKGNGGSESKESTADLEVQLQQNRLKKHFRGTVKKGMNFDAKCVGESQILSPSPKTGAQICLDLRFRVYWL